jgi:hypothetical protein
MTSITERLAELTAAIRADQRATTEAVLDELLSRPTGTLRAVAVDAARGSVVLVVDDLAVRAAVRRAAQAHELQRAHRSAAVELVCAAHLDEGQLLLGFSDGHRTLPVAVEALTRVAA